MSDPITLYVVSDHGFVQPRIVITPDLARQIVAMAGLISYGDDGFAHQPEEVLHKQNERDSILARLEKLEKAYACTEPDTLEILSSIEEQVRALEIAYQNHLTGYHGPVVTAAPQPTEQPDQKRVVVKMPSEVGLVGSGTDKVSLLSRRDVERAIRDAGGEIYGEITQ